MLNTGHYLTILLFMGGTTVATIGLRRSIYQGLVGELKTAFAENSSSVPVIIRDLSFVRGIPYLLGLVAITQFIFLVFALTHESEVANALAQSGACLMFNYALQVGTFVFILVFVWSVIWTATHRHSFL